MCNHEKLSAYISSIYRKKISTDQFLFVANNIILVEATREILIPGFQRVLEII